MLELHSSSLFAALSCQNKGPPPIWLMRQAGRCIPAYQALRRRFSLVEMFHNPDLITEVTLLPINLFHVDAAILFLDLLTVFDGLGIEWDFPEGMGPIIKTPITPETVLTIKPPQEVYSYIATAIQQLKQTLSVPLLGFAGAPFTLASYLIEGKTSRDLLRTKEFLYTHPQAFHKLLHTISLAVIDYINYQIEAGIDAVQIFDSWAHVLSLQDFREICLPYLKLILQGIRKKVPVILFCKGSCFFAKELAALSPAAISLDWQGEIASIRKEIPSTIALQGNLDPAVLLGPQELIAQKAKALLVAMRGDPGYIFNLGHGIVPGTPFENVKFLVDYVHNYS